MAREAAAHDVEPVGTGGWRLNGLLHLKLGVDAASRGRRVHLLALLFDLIVRIDEELVRVASAASGHLLQVHSGEQVRAADTTRAIIIIFFVSISFLAWLSSHLVTAAVLQSHHGVSEHSVILAVLDIILLLLLKLPESLVKLLLL